jgi:hypothetical protein
MRIKYNLEKILCSPYISSAVICELQSEWTETSAW